MYPDHVSTYQSRVLTNTPASAINEARKELKKYFDEKSIFQDNIFLPVIAVYAGWHDDITPIAINGEYV